MAINSAEIAQSQKCILRRSSVSFLILGDFPFVLDEDVEKILGQSIELTKALLEKFQDVSFLFGSRLTSGRYQMAQASGQESVTSLETGIISTNMGLKKKH